MLFNLVYDDRAFPTDHQTRQTWQLRVKYFDRRLFRRQLAEAVAWCAPRADPADAVGCLRTPALNPGMWSPENFTRLIRRRRRRLRGTPLPALEALPGALLLYIDGSNPLEGAVESESGGYLAGDQPPWDTAVYWLSYGHELLCWVPAPFVETVRSSLWAQSGEWLWLVESTEPPLL
ncbi:MAG: hypothetical protein ACFB51_00970 [Anaerolineae bacterium]